MWELLLDIVEDYFTSKGKEVPSAIKNYRKFKSTYRKFKRTVDNPPLAVKNIIKKSFKKSKIGSSISNNSKISSSINNNSTVKKVNKYLNIVSNRPNIKRKIIKGTINKFKKNIQTNRQIKADFNSIEPHLKTARIAVFVGLKSSWVESGMWIPLAKVGKRYYGVMSFTTKGKKGKTYDVFNFTLEQWKSILTEWTTPYGHGAGSFLWKHNMLKKKKHVYRAKARTLLKKTGLKTSVLIKKGGYNKLATIKANNYLAKTKRYKKNNGYKRR